MKRIRPKLSITIGNFKISQLEEKLELPKVPLKSENYKIKLHKQTITLPKIVLFKIYLNFWNLHTKCYIFCLGKNALSYMLVFFSKGNISIFWYCSVKIRLNGILHFGC
jgi:hypothetical protein